MSRSKATAAIKAIGPVLSTDVKVIIYACGVARGTKEDESWTKGTMEGGGADSFAGQMRDAAVDAGLTNAEVWGHTTTGHATRNPALRFFSAASGKGAEGQSYVSARIFDEWFRFIAYAELLAAIITKGFSVNDKNIERVGKYAQKYLTQQMYSCYVRATSNKENAPELMFKGVNLAEMAPLYPGEVAAIVRKYWHDKCWSDVAKENAAKKVIKATKLKKVSSAGK